MIIRCEISKLEACIVLWVSSEEAFIKSKLKVTLEVSLLHLVYPALSSLSQKQTSNSVPHHKMPDLVCHSGEKNHLNPLILEGSIHLFLFSCFAQTFFPPCFTLGRSLFWTVPPTFIWEKWEIRLIYSPLFSGSNNTGWECDFWAAGFLIKMVRKKTDCRLHRLAQSRPTSSSLARGDRRLKTAVSVKEKMTEKTDLLTFFKQF